MVVGGEDGEKKGRVLFTPALPVFSFLKLSTRSSLSDSQGLLWLPVTQTVGNLGYQKGFLSGI